MPAEGSLVITIAVGRSLVASGEQRRGLLSPEDRLDLVVVR